MSHSPISTYFIVLIAVRRGDQFLIIQENKPGFPWYLPAGHVEPGETFIEAARRECREEAGIDIVVDGLVRIEHKPVIAGDTRLRLFLAAHPADDTPPKSVADKNSLGARWITLDELGQYQQRHREMGEFFHHVARNPVIAPASFFHAEADGFR
jgi:8-oxo-dGTP pyrophosphatase MutT (NUDIX family)